MRTIKRFTLAITASLILLTLLLTLSKPPRPPTPSPSPSRRTTPPKHSSGRPYKKPTQSLWTPPRPRPASPRKPPSQLIVKVHLPHEDVSWLASLAATWTNNLVPIDARFTRLHAGAHRADRGRTASAYLAWIVENYHNLPTNIVFLGPSSTPSARTQRSHDDDVNSNNNNNNDDDDDLPLAALRLPTLQKTGFIPLPCPAPTACASPLRPFTHPPQTLRTLDESLASAWRTLFNVSAHTAVPTGLAVVPGAQFAVSRAQVLARDVGEYQRFWAWVQRTRMDDESAGLVMEVLWPVVFGRAEAYCPEFGTCECEAFGRC